MAYSMSVVQGNTMYGGLTHGVAVGDSLTMNRGVAHRMAVSHSLCHPGVVVHSHHWHVANNMTHVMAVAH